LRCFYCILFANSRRNANSSHAAVYWKRIHSHTSDMCRKREAQSNRLRASSLVSIRFGWLEFPAAANQNKQIIPAPSSFTSHINHVLHPIKPWHFSSPNHLKVTVKHMGALHLLPVGLCTRISPCSSVKRETCEKEVMEGCICQGFAG